jgi:hypothetical protein
MDPHALAAQNILNKMRSMFGVQHVFRPIDASQFSHLSQKYYSECEHKLNKLNFNKILDIEDVTVRSTSPDPRSFLRIMSNSESKISAAIYHAKPIFPWLVLMFFMRIPSKVFEFQSVFSDDAFIQTTIAPPSISNSVPEKVIKQYYPNTSIEDLLKIHEKTMNEYLSGHPGVYPVHIDSFQAIIDHSKKTFEMTKAHLEEIGWVTRDYLYKHVGKDKLLADKIYDEIQNILRKENPNK